MPTFGYECKRLTTGYIVIRIFLTRRFFFKISVAVVFRSKIGLLTFSCASLTGPNENHWQPHLPLSSRVIQVYRDNTDVHQPFLSVFIIISTYNVRHQISETVFMHGKCSQIAFLTVTFCDINQAVLETPNKWYLKRVHPFRHIPEPRTNIFLPWVCGS